MAKLIGKLISSDEIKEKYLLNEEDKKNIDNGRIELENIFLGKDNRKVLIIGPCSADFEESLLEYAGFLSNISKKVEDKIKIVMRFYTGKPRTVGGWKGLQNSVPGEKPNLVTGIENSRRVAVSIIKKYGLLLADEMLHPNLINYMDDVYSYMAVGARSTENQYHREVASGVCIPIGMKNPTSGNIGLMINSIAAGQTPSTYVIGENVYETIGNDLCHGILRGGSTGPNYSLDDIVNAYHLMSDKKIKNPAIIVDTNHDNSEKKYEKQIDILENVINDISDNKELNDFVKGFMIESYIYDGRQDFTKNCKQGLSLTDPCIGLENTEKLIMKLYNNI